MTRTGKYNRGHREGCPSDVPEELLGYGCSCEWLDHIDEVKAKSGFHWRNDIFFFRLPDNSVRLRQFSRYNGCPVYNDQIIPAAEWASIIASVSATGETADTYEKACTFHAAPTGLTYTKPEGNEAEQL